MQRFDWYLPPYTEDEAEELEIEDTAECHGNTVSIKERLT